LLAVLGACAGHERAQPEAIQTGDAAASVSARDGAAPADAQLAASDAAAAADVVAIIIVNTPPGCSDPASASAEFPLPCPDASRALDAAALDAATVRDAGPAAYDASLCGNGACAEAAVADTDAAQIADASSTDAGAADAGLFGPCAELGRDCSHVFFEVQLPATCSLGKFLGSDTVNVRYQVCESCGKPGYIDQFMVQIKECGGCEPVYSEGIGGSPRLGANACREQSWSNVALAGTTAAGQACLDVYAAVGSSTNGSFNEGIHSIRVCRCDRSTGRCVHCDSSGCETP
jgi:hypothetical protein